MPCVFTALCNCARNKCAGPLKVSALVLFSFSFSLYLFICGVSHQVLLPCPASHCLCMWSCLYARVCIWVCVWSNVLVTPLKDRSRLGFALECVCVCLGIFVNEKVSVFHNLCPGAEFALKYVCVWLLLLMMQDWNTVFSPALFHRSHWFYSLNVMMCIYSRAAHMRTWRDLFQFSVSTMLKSSK